jgi:hypothetical protein
VQPLILLLRWLVPTIRGLAVRFFVFHIEDDRSDAAAVRRASVRNEFEARALARRILLETYHHRSVEVLEASQQICLLSAQEA